MDDNSNDGNGKDDDIGSKGKGASLAGRAPRAESANGMTTLPINRPTQAMGLTVEGPPWVRSDDTKPDALGPGEAAAAAARRKGRDDGKRGVDTAKQRAGTNGAQDVCCRVRCRWALSEKKASFDYLPMKQRRSWDWAQATVVCTDDTTSLLTLLLDEVAVASFLIGGPVGSLHKRGPQSTEPKTA